MPDIIVPTAQAETLTQPQTPFPKGAWQGRIEEIHQRTLDYLQGRTQEQLNRQGHTSDEVTVATIQIGSNRGLEGQDDVGERKFFAPNNTGIVVRDGNYHLTDDNVPETAWQLHRSRRIIANLALALGQTIQEGDQTRVAENFVDALLDGEFKGQEVGYVVAHRPWESKDGEKSGVEELVETFAPAV